MKKLYLMTHPAANGLQDTIGQKGLKFAFNRGYAYDLQFDKLFHGPLARTASTALAFYSGLCYRPRNANSNHLPTIMPAVFGLGDDAFFSKVGTNNFKSAVKNGLSKFSTVRKVHGDEKAMAWAKQGHSAVMAMFEAMEDNETGVGFFHSPTIELTAWVCKATESGVAKWSKLGDMEGLIFAYDNLRIEIRIIDKISVKTKVRK